MRHLHTRTTRRRVVGALTAGLLCAAGLAAPALAAPAGEPTAPTLADGVALTPPMGFNNWNSTHCRPEFNESMVKGTADLFVEKGLKDAGYQYVNLDDCWALPTGTRTADSYRTRSASRTGSRRSPTTCTPRGSSSASTPARARRRATAPDSRVRSATSTATPGSSRTGAWTTSSTTTAITRAWTPSCATPPCATLSRRPAGPSSTASANGARTSPGSGRPTSAICGARPATSATAGARCCRS